MSLKETLNALEEKFYGEAEEDRSAVLPELEKLYDEARAAGADAAAEFEAEVGDKMGGVFLPYIFWVKLSDFEADNSKRQGILDCLRVWSDSSFEEEEQKKMKPLLIAYFAMEKEFEIDRLKTLVIEPAHPAVQEWFDNIMTFRERNQTSAEMYIEKFELLKGSKPDFELFRLPVMKLREQLASV